MNSNGIKAADLPSIKVATRHGWVKASLPNLLFDSTSQTLVLKGDCLMRQGYGTLHVTPEATEEQDPAHRDPRP